MDSGALGGEVIRTLGQAGFPLVGTCRAEVAEADEQRYRKFLRLHLHGPLGYVERSAALRGRPRSFLSWARGVFCVALPYNTSRERSAAHIHAGAAWVSRYAWGRDYHKILKGRLRAAARLLVEAGFKARVCVDSAPVLERALAARAGLGFVGKNGCLIHPELGSYVFLGEILTDLELPEGERLNDGCGDCDLCLKACPAGAFASPRVLDAGRCLATWTIEWLGEFPERAPALKGHLFGCDRCQEVCPYNRDAPLAMEREFEQRPGWFAPEPALISNLTRDEWDEMTLGTAIRRARYDGLVRNANKILAERKRA
jgi:epoxyqueuosine reductase